ncbi:MAG: prephenate dehydratase [Anaerolineae bacterium]|jgi:prephenate dehydratase
MTRVAFQGERGAYSDEAIHGFFGPEVETLPCPSFEEIFQAVESGAGEYGMLPVENSTAGSINRAYDLLLDHDLRVWGEAILRVRHALLAAPGTSLAEVRQVRSHPHALAQCERYLANRGWVAETAYDTAGSARDLAAEPEPGVAVIASRLAGRLYGLEELAYGIEDAFYNYTRFFVLSHEDPPRAERNKTSVVFASRHQPGALYECLGEFARREINLSKLESRPRFNRPWQYVFYLDFDGHCEDPECEAALMGLLRRASFVKLLGSYPAADGGLPDQPRAGEGAAVG